MTQELPADGRALPDRREPSAAIRAAQERLLELRRQHGIPTHGRDELRATSYELRVQREERSMAASLASGASFYSEPLTLHLRAIAARQQSTDTTYEIRDTSSEDAGSPAPLLPCPPAPPLHSSLVISSDDRSRHSSLVRVYPDLALAILRRKKAAPGRVWLLLRGHDAQGRGRVPAREAARLLAGDGSPLRVCGRRQLANLLAAGDGLFWDRAPGRSGEEQLWLRGVARVAAALGVERLGGSPVAVPLAALTGTIGHFRAHLYASFHSGRQRPDRRTGRPRARGPISRSTLCKLSGVTSNSQRNYERRARVNRRPAIAVGPLAGAADEHEVAWRRGRALFRLRDDKGRYGRPGAVYLAWQLPNEYTGPHAPLPRGRQKRLNRALADLFHNGMTGNGERDEWRVASGELRVQKPTGRRGAGEQGSRGERLPTAANGSVSDNHCPVDSGQSVVSSKQWSVVSGQWSAVGSDPATRHSPPATRRFYPSAKSAFLARGGHERYWRCGEAWLWQPELRVMTPVVRRDDELRVKRRGDSHHSTADCGKNLTQGREDAKDAKQDAPDHPPLATRHLHPERRSKLVIRNS